MRKCWWQFSRILKMLVFSHGASWSMFSCRTLSKPSTAKSLLSLRTVQFYLKVIYWKKEQTYTSQWVEYVQVASLPVLKKTLCLGLWNSQSHGCRWRTADRHRELWGYLEKKWHLGATKCLWKRSKLISFELLRVVLNIWTETWTI